MSQLTSLLDAAPPGSPASAEQLLPLVYAELRQMAARKMAALAAGQTLQPTALVHEAWLRLGADEPRRFAGRQHFFAAAAEAMRQILIDAARRKRAVRHGGGHARVDLEDVEIATVADDDELLAVHEALDKLAEGQPQQAAVAKLRYFVGLNFEEVAEVMGTSVRTAKRDWAFARAWLHREIKAAQAG